MKPQRSQRRFPRRLSCPLCRSTIASSTRPSTSAMRRKARCCGHTKLRMVNGVGNLDKLVRNPPPSYLTLPPPENNRPNLFATTSATRGGYPLAQAVLPELVGGEHAT